VQHQKACRNIPLLFQGHRCRGTPDREHTDDGLDLPASVVQKVRDVDRRGYFTTDNQPGQRHSWLRPPGRAQATAPPLAPSISPKRELWQCQECPKDVRRQLRDVVVSIVNE